MMDEVIQPKGEGCCILGNCAPWWWRGLMHHHQQQQTLLFIFVLKGSTQCQSNLCKPVEINLHEKNKVCECVENIIIRFFFLCLKNENVRMKS